MVKVRGLAVILLCVFSLPGGSGGLEAGDAPEASLQYRSLIVTREETPRASILWEGTIPSAGGKRFKEEELGKDLTMIPLEYWTFRFGAPAHQAVTGGDAALVKPGGAIPGDVKMSLARWLQRCRPGTYQAYSLTARQTEFGEGPWIWEKGDGNSWKWYDVSGFREGQIDYEIREWVPAAQAAVDLRARDSLNRQAWRITWRPRSGLPDAAMDLGDLRRGRWKILRKVQTGEIIRRYDIRNIPDVKPGEPVTLRLIRGRMTVTMKGKAMHTASRGDLLRLRTEQGAVYRGELRDHQRVVIRE